MTATDEFASSGIAMIAIEKNQSPTLDQGLRNLPIV
jgi:hypothetical protein